MEAVPELSELRSAPLDSLDEWLRARVPGHAAPQRWQSLFESIESAVSPLREAAYPQRIADLRIGAVAVKAAVERRDVDVPFGAYWMLRIAAAALRLDVPARELPDVLTPDGAVAWALGRLPASRETYRELARARRDQHSAAEESSFAPVGVPFDFSGMEPDRETASLIGVEKILSALPWVVDHVQDPALRREIDAWLEGES